MTTQTTIPFICIAFRVVVLLDLVVWKQQEPQINNVRPKQTKPYQQPLTEQAMIMLGGAAASQRS